MNVVNLVTRDDKISLISEQKQATPRSYLGILLLMFTIPKFIKKKRVYIPLILIVGALIFFTVQKSNKVPTWTTDTVSQGTVRNIISVSGAVDAVGSADLTFPVQGILESLGVKEGDQVTKGQLLATLVHGDLKAEYQDAQASLRIAEANKDELVNGLSTEARDVSRTTAEIARQELTRVTNEQNDRVKNAYRTLLSSDLEARPRDNSNDDTPPIISGTYTCGEGTYTIDIYNSGARSGYSYKLSGMESGTFTAYTKSPASLGTCGLQIQFADGIAYGNGSWVIEIPNTKSDSYVTNQNAYKLAVTQRINAIHEAEQKLTLAEQNNVLDTATPRVEALEREKGKVQQAQARLSVIEAQIKDHILYAPFDGTVTNIDPVPGEALTNSPAVTMVSNDAFALTALIPEIDVTKVTIGQKADVVFDARQSETLPATVIFISPLAKEVDGVSYFEAKLTLDQDVDWLRSGLNADVDIIVESRENVVRIPKRYLIDNNGAYTVLVPDGKVTRSVPVTNLFSGNDGFVQIEGLGVGDTIIAP